MQVLYHKKAIKFINSLPMDDRLELSKKLLLAYDPDYTKVLPHEAKAIDEALTDYAEGVNFCDDSNIEW